MKASLITILCLSFLVISCDSGEESIAPRETDDVITSEMAPGQYFVNFNALFYSVLTPTDEDAGCAPPMVAQVKQVGYGKAAQLGKLKFESLFCIDPATRFYGEGENTYGRFIFDNGDVLNILAVEGQVLLSDHPKYDAEFQDELEFMGGTGRFEGAYGKAVTNSYVTFFPDGTDSTIHHWKGTLYLPAGK